jgi:hypothetical protein
VGTAAPRPQKSKKLPKNSKFQCFFEILKKVYVQNPKTIACWMRPDKNSFGHTVVGILTRRLDYLILTFNHYCVSTTYQKFSSLAVQEEVVI